MVPVYFSRQRLCSVIIDLFKKDVNQYLVVYSIPYTDGPTNYEYFSKQSLFPGIPLLNFCG